MPSQCNTHPYDRTMPTTTPPNGVNCITQRALESRRRGQVNDGVKPREGNDRAVQTETRRGAHKNTLSAVYHYWAETARVVQHGPTSAEPTRRALTTVVIATNTSRLTQPTKSDTRLSVWPLSVFRCLHTQLFRCGALRSTDRQFHRISVAGPSPALHSRPAVKRRARAAPRRPLPRLRRVTSRRRVTRRCDPALQRSGGSEAPDRRDRCRPPRANHRQR